VHETQIGGGHLHFGTTHWSLVLRAGDPDRPGFREALEALIRQYWKPVYMYIRRIGHSVEDAKDLTQDFFGAFLRRRLPGKSDPERGRFRTYLRTAVRNFLHDAHDRSSAEKRGGGERVLSLGLPKGDEGEWSIPVPDHLTPEALFDRQWKETVVREAMDALQSYYREQKKEREFSIFQRYAREVLDGGTPSYDVLCKEFAVSETTLTNLLHRARQRYRIVLLHIVGQYSASRKEAEQEIEEMFGRGVMSNEK